MPIPDILIREKTEDLMPRNKFRFTAALLFIMLLLSCSRNVVFTDSAEMPSSIWEIHNVTAFNVPVNDTVAGNNIYFNVRTGTSYPYRNIYLFVTTTSPDGRSITDTLQYYLADEKGKWYGKGFGDIHELILPYKSNVYFPRKGTYHITIQHGMRIKDLKGVYDFGLRVEKINKQDS
jgi:gliding motility-associated lipoprotein GldH